MKKILISDLTGIWIEKNEKILNKINEKIIGKIEINEKEWKKLKRFARIGKISSFQLGAIFYKKLGFKNFIELRLKFREMELKNARKIFKVVKNAKSVLKKLKKKRIKIIIISDSINESCYLKTILKKIGLLKYFDIVLTSHDLGVEKPKALKYFTYLKEKYEVYFLGHDNDEIIGAKNYGFKTIGLKNKSADIFIKNITELLKIF